jgi:hypothetical protein
MGGLAGHCTGLFQTIRDEGAPEEGRGAVNYLGTLVQVIDDPANDELEVHIGKQPNLTDLFAVADVMPELTMGNTGSRINGRLAVNANPSTTDRVLIDEGAVAINPAGTTYNTLQLLTTAALSKALVTLRGLHLSGTVDLGGFNVTNWLGLNFAPTIRANAGASVITLIASINSTAGLFTSGGGLLTITNIETIRSTGSVQVGVAVTDWKAFVAKAVFPIGTVVTRMGYDCEDQTATANLTNAYGYRVREFVNAIVIARPFQEEGSPLGDTYGNRFPSNTWFGSLVAAFAGGQGVVGLANAAGEPAGAVAGGGLLYCLGGISEWQDSAGNKSPLSDAQAAKTLANGNNNDITLELSARFHRISGPGAAFTITGIAGGFPGRRVWIYNSTAQNMTIGHEDANSAAANRIRSMTGGAQTTAGEGAALLVYDSVGARWILADIAA